MGVEFVMLGLTPKKNDFTIEIFGWSGVIMNMVLLSKHMLSELYLLFHHNQMSFLN
jgi:hypothetical protein